MGNRLDLDETENPKRFRIETIRTSGTVIDVVAAIHEVLKSRSLPADIVVMDLGIDRVSLIEETDTDGHVRYEIELW